MQQGGQMEPAHTMWGAGIYGFAWLFVFLLSLISYLAIATDTTVVSSTGSGSSVSIFAQILSAIFVGWVPAFLFGCYSVFSWYMAAKNPAYVPNNCALIAGAVVCGIAVPYQFPFAYIYQAAWTVVTALGACRPPYFVPICTSLEALLVGIWLYLIMTFATMIIMSVDSTTYFGCCCNGEGRASKMAGGGTAVVVQPVAVQGAPVQGYVVQPQAQYAGGAVQMQQQYPPQGYAPTGQQGYPQAAAAPAYGQPQA